MISLQNLMQALPSTPTSFPLDFIAPVATWRQWLCPGGSGATCPALRRLAHQASYLWDGAGAGNHKGGGFTPRASFASWANGTDAEGSDAQPGAEKWSALARLGSPDAPQCASRLWTGVSGLTIDHPSGSRRFVSGPSAHWSSQCAVLIGLARIGLSLQKSPCILGQLNK